MDEQREGIQSEQPSQINGHRQGIQGERPVPRDDHRKSIQADKPIPPWELPGRFRLDCEPHRGLMLEWIALASMIAVGLSVVPIPFLGSALPFRPDEFDFLRDHFEREPAHSNRRYRPIHQPRHREPGRGYALRAGGPRRDAPRMPRCLPELLAGSASSAMGERCWPAILQAWQSPCASLPFFAEHQFNSRAASRDTPPWKAALAPGR